MFRKEPTDNSFMVVISWVALTIVIGWGLYKWDQLCALVSNILFN